MANNSISRTGTFTSSGSAGGSGTYDYSGTSGYSGIDYYSNDDFKNGSIFNDIDDKIRIKFSEEVDDSSVTVFNNDIELSIDDQNKKGTIGLTHIVSSTLGATTDDNNLKALKLTSKPTILATDDHSATANQEIVEMVSAPTTENNQTFEFIPKANLSSNTTYFLRMDPDNIFDATGAGINYTIEKGFVTDNSQSFVTTNDYYDGFSMQIEPVSLIGEENEPNSDGVTEPQPTSLTLYRSGGTVSSATILNILSIEGTVLKYQLDPTSYQMNVAYTATNPIVISNINHELEDNDKIEVYDVVSGDAVRTGTYTVTELTSDTFSIPVDGTGSDAGRLNYYRNANKNDLFKWSQIDSDLKKTVEGGTVPWEWCVRKKALSVPKKSQITLDDTFLQFKIQTKSTSDGLDDGTVSGRIGKIIKFNEATNIISFVAVDTSEHGGKITTSAFVNNSIVDISTSTNDVRFHIKANTSPDHNVHPFHTFAPKVVSTFPEDGTSFPRKLTITQITRSGHRAIVSTNQPHNLFKDDFIKIVDSTQDIYNKTTKVLFVPTSNTFHYDLGASNDFSNVQSPAPGKPKLQISNDDGTTYAERYNAIFVNFSQSMNTSTIIVANNTHLISANGSTGDFVTTSSFAYEKDSASSTIQLSDDGFETIENCVSVTASAGNSVFAIVPKVLKARHDYNIKVKTDVQDLGKTNSLYQFTTTEGITTGIKVVDPQTGQETVYSKDEDPPKIKKISLAGHVLESSDLSEITSPDSYQSLAINPGAITVQFSETMKINSVTTATSNTNPTGTVQMSCDDFSTVVQMTSTSPVVSLTDVENDTFTFTPVANLSANAVYTLKILKDVTDDSPEENRMVQDNVSSIKVLTTNSVPASSDNYYSAGEIISGVRTLTIKANIGTPTIGVTAGSTFLGLTSKGKGKVLDFTEDSGAITSIRYTELAGNDGSIRPLSPGEICKVSDTVNFTIDNVAITDPPEGNVVSFTSGTKKLIYRDNRLTNEFVSGSASAERIFGRTSGGEVFASSSGSEGIVGEGVKTTTTTITPNAHFYSPGGVQLPSPADGPQVGVGVRSNLTFHFNQTMDPESFDFNAIDSITRDRYNIILSYDSNFQNTIPLSTTFTSSNNDTAFEFQPKILANSVLTLTQGMQLYVKIPRNDAIVADNLKNKGDMNVSMTWDAVGYGSNTETSGTFGGMASFILHTAVVFTEDGQEVELGRNTETGAGRMPNISSIIAPGTPIILHFNEVPDLSTFSFGLGDEIELSTTNDFTSAVSLGNGSLTRVGEFGTQIMITLGSNLTDGQRYYLRVNNGGASEGGESFEGVVSSQTNCNSFTIKS